MGASGTDPTVSVLIPAFNEEGHIDGCLASVAAQTFPQTRMEVLVIDGDSTDRTVALAEAWTSEIPGLRIVPNPDRLQAPGLNRGIEQATGDIIVRMDAHTGYASDYVERCVAALETSDAAVVGGPMRPAGRNGFGRAVATATSTPMGVGPGKFHYSERREAVDTVYLGAYRRSLVLDLGGYDPNLAVGEDADFTYRVRRNGGIVLLDPSIRSTYTPRGSARALAKQYFRYGQAKVDLLRKHGELPSWRPLAPAALLVAIVLTLPLLWKRSGRRLVAAIWAGYTGSIFAGVAGEIVADPAQGLRIVGAIVVMHLSYGTGFWQRALVGSPRSQLG
jgi:glycosyltransferase involved in cell wall biosynthesis